MYKGNSISSCFDENAGDLWNLPYYLRSRYRSEIFLKCGDSVRLQGMWLTANLHWPWVKRCDNAAPHTGPLVNMAELRTDTFHREKRETQVIQVFDYKDRRRTSQLPSYDKSWSVNSMSSAFSHQMACSDMVTP